jgi:hypothetical protein
MTLQDQDRGELYFPPDGLRGFAFGERLAGWHYRIGAAAIDYGGLWLLPQLILERNGLPSLSDLWWAITLLNVILLKGRTSQSLGYRLLGMQIMLPVRTPHMGDLLVLPGYGRLLVRHLAHLLDMFPYPPIMAGLVVPLFTRNHATFADLAVRTLVFRPYQRLPLVRRPQGAQTIAHL